MSTIIKKLEGYSGSTVLLMQDGTTTFIRKVNNIDRNLTQLKALQGINIDMPQIIAIADNHYDMEYIAHTDMVNWLLHNQVDQFTDWIINCIEQLKKTESLKDWTNTYIARLSNSGLDIFWPKLTFTADMLISKLPKILPCSQYHGDLTMENCIHGANGKFYLIDPISTDYNSWVFDLAKLMQDLESGWFIRNKNVMIQGKLWSIKSIIVNTYPEVRDTNLLILMLLRILPYAKNTQDQTFLIKEINRLWTF